MFRIRIKLLFLSSYEDLMFGEDEEEERPGLKAKKVTISCLSLLLWKSMGGHISQKWYEFTTVDPQIDRYS